MKSACTTGVAGTIWCLLLLRAASQLGRCYFEPTVCLFDPRKLERDVEGRDRVEPATGTPEEHHNQPCR